VVITTRDDERKALMTPADTKSDVPIHLDGQAQIEEALGERMRPLVYLPLDQIKVIDNPRETAEEPALEALTTSTRRLGILQTVLVRRLDNEEYELIAGGRRFEASRRAGRPFIPAMVIEKDEEIDEPTRIAMAILENTQHVNLTPLEQAKKIGLLISSYGMSLDGAADLLCMTVPLAEQRVALLKLPDGVKARIAAGELTLGNAMTLAPIAAKSERVADALADRVASGAQPGRALDSDPAAALRRLADEETQPPGAFIIPFGAHDSVNLDEVVRRIRDAANSELIPESASKEVETALKGVEDSLTGIPLDFRTATVEEADADRARAYDGLIEYREGAYRRSGVLVDPVFAADWAKEAAGRLADGGAETDQTGSELPADREDPKEARERRKAEHLAAKGANGHLDREVISRFDFQEEVPLEQAQVIAAVLLELLGRDLAVGHRVVREAWMKRDVKPYRGGTRIVEDYPSIDEAPGLLEEEWRKATTGPALIGRIFGTIASAVLSDQRVLGSGARPNLELPYGLGREQQLQGLASGALWTEAEICLTEERAHELEHLFRSPDEDGEKPRRDRLAPSDHAGTDSVLELFPDSDEIGDEPEEAKAA
jgi:ParB/RepB/Spo0J family partition protein